MSVVHVEVPCLCGSGKRYKECACYNPTKNARMKIHSSTGEVEGGELNIAKALKDVAKNMLSIASNEMEYRNVISMALGAWNIALISDRNLRSKAMKVQVQGFVYPLPYPPPGYHAQMASMLHTLVENKLRLYPKASCHIQGLGIYSLADGSHDIHVEFDPVVEDTLCTGMTTQVVMSRIFTNNSQNPVN